LAVSESTPGPIGVNMATYAGYNAAGLAGGVVATLSLVLPSLIVIVIVAKILESFSRNPYVKAAFASIRPAVTGLIAMAVLGIWETSLFSTPEGFFQAPVLDLSLCVITYLLMHQKKLKTFHPAFWIFCGAIIGIVFKM